MARVPDVLCAGDCGKLLYGSSTSLPAGQRTCRACRKTSEAHTAPAPCKLEHCTQPAKAKGYCNHHYAKLALPARCKLDDCDNPRHARGMCRTHYRRWARANGLAKSPSDAWSDSRRNVYHSRRASHAGATRSDKVMLADLLERDAASCSECDQHIDVDLAYPEPMSPSIDHTIPLSRGGEHSMDNTTAMHLRCNLSKGARIEAA